MKFLSGVLLCCWAFAAQAELPDNTQRPLARPLSEAPEVIRPQSRLDLQETDLIRPQLRPDLPQFQRVEPLPSNAWPDFNPQAVAQSLRPILRPAAITRRVVEARAARARGQVCGDPDIQGEAIGRVEGRGACGVSNAVRVRSIAGVTLSTRAVMDCRTAAALKTWITRGARPAVGDTGGGIASLRVVAHYACRTRNNQPGARLSEHANGRAIDIAGIGLRNGREITVLSDWGGGGNGRRLREMWRAACGPFGTVLGPEANRYHRDHFHFDTARYRSGSYCR